VESLIQRLEAKLLPVPDTQVRMSKTHVTVGEWKVFLQDTKAPAWQQPDSGWTQTDEHPVVMVDWNDAQNFCEWLTQKTGKRWRLPKVSEWKAAVGNLEYPWGNYFPPLWDDGNYAFLADGRDDPQQTGVDGIKGTAPVASFKPNTLGFYDLGGNAHQWMMDGSGPPAINRHALRGGGWREKKIHLSASEANSHRSNNIGFRLVRE
jgi:formylglycine-generating enzyme required for sulfatase activity